jgi:Transposase IS200 like
MRCGPRRRKPPLDDSVPSGTAKGFVSSPDSAGTPGPLARKAGNERKDIFRDDADHFHFLELLSELGERFGVRAHAYVLMDNPYHLLLETPEPNLSRAMHWLNASYCLGTTSGTGAADICSRGALVHWLLRTTPAGRKWRATCLSIRFG